MTLQGTLTSALMPDEARRLARIMNGFFPAFTSQRDIQKKEAQLSKSGSLRDRNVRLCQDPAILHEANCINRFAYDL